MENDQSGLRTLLEVAPYPEPHPTRRCRTPIRA
jgi:hypothetical protein